MKDQHQIKQANGAEEALKGSHSQIGFISFLCPGGVTVCHGSGDTLGVLQRLCDS